MTFEGLRGYFDYNATTPLSEEVVQCIKPRLAIFANPSSSSRLASESKSVVHQARQNVAQLLGADPGQIFFTSGGSESNNWAIKSTVLQGVNVPGHIVTTAIEHPSVLEPIKYFANTFGFEVTLLQPDKQGLICPEQIKNSIRPDTRLVSIMHANNETGAIQPINEIANITNQAGIVLHVDAVQLVGKQELNLSRTKADLVSLSAHKFYGPKGIGCLYVREPQKLTPLIHGGGQESGTRSGTENLIALIGIAKAAEEANLRVPTWKADNQVHKTMMVELLKASGVPFKINGPQKSELALSNTLNISIKGIRGEALALRLDTNHGIQVSIGSACSNNKQSQHSHVLTAMGLSEEVIQGAIRISFGQHTRKRDVKDFVAALCDEVKALWRLSGRKDYA